MARRVLVESKICASCGRRFARTSRIGRNEWAKRRHCSFTCRHRGPRAVARVIAGDSKLSARRPGQATYRMLFCPWHPAARQGWVYEHRILAERREGRLLRRDEHVHHVNGDSLDNRPENLQVLSAREHRLAHCGVTDEQIAGMIRLGLSSRQIQRVGVSSHRVVRVRREMELAA